jgi:hypothetical protein
MELELNKFDPRILEKKRREGHAPRIVFIGSPGSGKSTLVADILYHMRAIPYVVCMSGTLDGCTYYKKYIHDLCIFNKYEPSVVEAMINAQKKKAEKLGEEQLKYHPEQGVGLLIDDLAYDNKKIMKHEAIREIFYNGRHYSCVCFITFQYLMDMFPNFRTTVDYVFVCKENKKDTIEKLYKYFFGIFDNVADFKKVLQACTEDYKCMVLDNTSRSNNIEEQVFWYKANVDNKFKIAEQNWPRWDTLVKINQEREREKYADRKSKSTSDLRIKMKGYKDDDDENERG